MGRWEYDQAARGGGTPPLQHQDRSSASTWRDTGKGAAAQAHTSALASSPSRSQPRWSPPRNYFSSSPGVSPGALAKKDSHRMPSSRGGSQPTSPSAAVDAKPLGGVRPSPLRAHSMNPVASHGLPSLPPGKHRLSRSLTNLSQIRDSPNTVLLVGPSSSSQPRRLTDGTYVPILAVTAPPSDGRSSKSKASSALPSRQHSFSSSHRNDSHQRHASGQHSLQTLGRSPSRDRSGSPTRCQGHRPQSRNHGDSGRARRQHSSNDLHRPRAACRHSSRSPHGSRHSTGHHHSWHRSSRTPSPAPSRHHARSREAFYGSSRSRGHTSSPRPRHHNCGERYSSRAGGTQPLASSVTPQRSRGESRERQIPSSSHASYAPPHASASSAYQIENAAPQQPPPRFSYTSQQPPDRHPSLSRGAASSGGRRLISDIPNAGALARAVSTSPRGPSITAGTELPRIYRQPPRSSHGFTVGSRAYGHSSSGFIPSSPRCAAPADRAALSAAKRSPAHSVSCCLSRGNSPSPRGVRRRQRECASSCDLQPPPCGLGAPAAFMRPPPEAPGCSRSASPFRQPYDASGVYYRDGRPLRDPDPSEAVKQSSAFSGVSTPARLGLAPWELDVPSCAAAALASKRSPSPLVFRSSSSAGSCGEGRHAFRSRRCGGCSDDCPLTGSPMPLPLLETYCDDTCSDLSRSSLSCLRFTRSFPRGKSRETFLNDCVPPQTPRACRPPSPVDSLGGRCPQPSSLLLRSSLGREQDHLSICGSAASLKQDSFLKGTRDGALRRAADTVEQSLAAASCSAARVQRTLSCERAVASLSPRESGGANARQRSPLGRGALARGTMTSAGLGSGGSGLSGDFCQSSGERHISSEPSLASSYSLSGSACRRTSPERGLDNAGGLPHSALNAQSSLTTSLPCLLQPAGLRCSPRCGTPPRVCGESGYLAESPSFPPPRNGLETPSFLPAPSEGPLLSARLSGEIAAERMRQRRHLCERADAREDSAAALGQSAGARHQEAESGESTRSAIRFSLRPPSPLCEASRCTHLSEVEAIEAEVEFEERRRQARARGEDDRRTEDLLRSLAALPRLSLEATRRLDAQRKALLACRHRRSSCSLTPPCGSCELPGAGSAVGCCLLPAARCGHLPPSPRSQSPPRRCLSGGVAEQGPLAFQGTGRVGESCPFAGGRAGDNDVGGNSCARSGEGSRVHCLTEILDRLSRAQEAQCENIRRRSAERAARCRAPPPGTKEDEAAAGLDASAETHQREPAESSRQGAGAPRCASPRCRLHSGETCRRLPAGAVRGGAGGRALPAVMQIKLEPARLAQIAAARETRDALVAAFAGPRERNEDRGRGRRREVDESRREDETERRGSRLSPSSCVSALSLRLSRSSHCTRQSSIASNSPCPSSCSSLQAACLSNPSSPALAPLSRAASRSQSRPASPVCATPSTGDGSSRPAGIAAQRLRVPSSTEEGASQSNGQTSAPSTSRGAKRPSRTLCRSAPPPSPSRGPSQGAPQLTAGGSPPSGRGRSSEDLRGNSKEVEPVNHPTTKRTKDSKTPPTPCATSGRRSSRDSTTRSARRHCDSSSRRLETAHRHGREKKEIAKKSSGSETRPAPAPSRSLSRASSAAAASKSQPKESAATHHPAKESKGKKLKERRAKAVEGRSLFPSPNRQPSRSSSAASARGHHRHSGQKTANRERAKKEKGNHTEKTRLSSALSRSGVSRQASSASTKDPRHHSSSRSSSKSRDRRERERQTRLSRSRSRDTRSAAEVPKHSKDERRQMKRSASATAQMLSASSLCRGTPSSARRDASRAPSFRLLSVPDPAPKRSSSSSSTRREESPRRAFSSSADRGRSAARGERKARLSERRRRNGETKKPSERSSSRTPSRPPSRSRGEEAMKILKSSSKHERPDSVSHRKASPSRSTSRLASTRSEKGSAREKEGKEATHPEKKRDKHFHDGSSLKQHGSRAAPPALHQGHSSPGARRETAYPLVACLSFSARPSRPACVASSLEKSVSPRKPLPHSLHSPAALLSALRRAEPNKLSSPSFSAPKSPPPDIVRSVLQSAGLPAALLSPPPASARFLDSATATATAAPARLGPGGETTEGNAAYSAGSQRNAQNEAAADRRTCPPAAVAATALGCADGAAGPGKLPRRAQEEVGCEFLAPQQAARDSPQSLNAATAAHASLAPELSTAEDLRRNAESCDFPSRLFSLPWPQAVWRPEESVPSLSALLAEDLEATAALCRRVARCADSSASSGSPAALSDALSAARPSSHSALPSSASLSSASSLQLPLDLSTAASAGTLSDSAGSLGGVSECEVSTSLPPSSSASSLPAEVSTELVPPLAAQAPGGSKARDARVNANEVDSGKTSDEAKAKSKEKAACFNRDANSSRRALPAHADSGPNEATRGSTSPSASAASSTHSATASMPPPVPTSLSLSSSSFGSPPSPAASRRVSAVERHFVEVTPDRPSAEEGGGRAVALSPSQPSPRPPLRPVAAPAAPASAAAIRLMLPRRHELLPQLSAFVPHPRRLPQRRERNRSPPRGAASCKAGKRLRDENASARIPAASARSDARARLQPLPQRARPCRSPLAPLLADTEGGHVDEGEGDGESRSGRHRQRRRGRSRGRRATSARRRVATARRNGGEEEDFGVHPGCPTSAKLRDLLRAIRGRQPAGDEQAEAGSAAEEQNEGEEAPEEEADDGGEDDATGDEAEEDREKSSQSAESTPSMRWARRSGFGDGSVGASFEEAAACDLWLLQQTNGETVKNLESAFAAAELLSPLAAEWASSASFLSALPRGSCGSGAPLRDAARRGDEGEGEVQRLDPRRREEETRGGCAEAVQLQALLSPPVCPLARPHLLMPAVSSAALTTHVRAAEAVAAGAQAESRPEQVAGSAGVRDAEGEAPTDAVCKGGLSRDAEKERRTEQHAAEGEREGCGGEPAEAAARARLHAVIRGHGGRSTAEKARQGKQSTPRRPHADAPDSAEGGGMRTGFEVKEWETARAKEKLEESEQAAAAGNPVAEAKTKYQTKEAAASPHEADSEMSSQRRASEVDEAASGSSQRKALRGFSAFVISTVSSRLHPAPASACPAPAASLASSSSPPTSLGCGSAPASSPRSRSRPPAPPAPFASFLTLSPSAEPRPPSPSPSLRASAASCAACPAAACAASSPRVARTDPACAECPPKSPLALRPPILSSSGMHEEGKSAPAVAEKDATKQVEAAGSADVESAAMQEGSVEEKRDAGRRLAIGDEDASQDAQQTLAGLSDLTEKDIQRERSPGGNETEKSASGERGFQGRGAASAVSEAQTEPVGDWTRAAATCPSTGPRSNCDSLSRRERQGITSEAKKAALGRLLAPSRAEPSPSLALESREVEDAQRRKLGMERVASPALSDFTFAMESPSEAPRELDGGADDATAAAPALNRLGECHMPGSDANGRRYGDTHKAVRCQERQERQEREAAESSTLSLERRDGTGEEVHPVWLCSAWCIWEEETEANAASSAVPETRTCGVQATDDAWAPPPLDAAASPTASASCLLSPSASRASLSAFYPQAHLAAPERGRSEKCGHESSTAAAAESPSSPCGFAAWRQTWGEKLEGTGAAKGPRRRRGGPHAAEMEALEAFKEVRRSRDSSEGRDTGMDSAECRDTRSAHFDSHGPQAGGWGGRCLSPLSRHPSPLSAEGREQAEQKQTPRAAEDSGGGLRSEERKTTSTRHGLSAVVAFSAKLRRPSLVRLKDVPALVSRHAELRTSRRRGREGDGKGARPPTRQKRKERDSPNADAPRVFAPRMAECPPQDSLSARPPRAAELRERAQGFVLQPAERELQRRRKPRLELATHPLPSRLRRCLLRGLARRVAPSPPPVSLRPTRVSRCSRARSPPAAALREQAKSQEPRQEYRRKALACALPLPAPAARASPPASALGTREPLREPSFTAAVQALSHPLVLCGSSLEALQAHTKELRARPNCEARPQRRHKALHKENQLVKVSAASQNARGQQADTSMFPSLSDAASPQVQGEHISETDSPAFFSPAFASHSASRDAHSRPQAKSPSLSGCFAPSAHTGESGVPLPRAHLPASPVQLQALSPSARLSPSSARLRRCVAPSEAPACETVLALETHQTEARLHEARPILSHAALCSFASASGYDSPELPPRSPSVCTSSAALTPHLVLLQRPPCAQSRLPPFVQQAHASPLFSLPGRPCSQAHLSAPRLTPESRYPPLSSPSTHSFLVLNEPRGARPPVSPTSGPSAASKVPPSASPVSWRGAQAARAQTGPVEALGRDLSVGDRLAGEMPNPEKQASCSQSPRGGATGPSQSLRAANVAPDSRALHAGKLDFVFRLAVAGQRATGSLFASAASALFGGGDEIPEFPQKRG
ncbi:hypothetical protein BESB_055630 [Besnoitia besnoiti]|uniref:Uncharacterized protein n=1 Tax=Besnoitia besnoiti TaxID=94643 RepID=A0A2A9MKG9_BESBE|nr:hypothetical protein BESB_055630 [Besnoitia besnoiti]PFH35912.1 hypothetical protein BESB_055630 [Besnoitia besnoiti]